MVQRVLTADADPRAERIEDEPEDMVGLAGPIRTGHGLQRQRAGRQNQIESPVRDFSGDGVLGRRIVLRVESLDRDGFALFESSFRKAQEHPMHAFVQDRLRRMLENRDTGDRLAAIASAVPIRKQQNANGERDENHAERKPFDDVDHSVPECVCGNGMRREGG